MKDQIETNDDTPEETSAGIVIEPETLPAVLSSNEQTEALIVKIETHFRSMPADPSTAKGRKEIKSQAYSVARTKTMIDTAGKKLTEDARKQIEAVNSVRKVVTERLDHLRDEIGKPAKEWEEAEAKRLAAHQTSIRSISEVTAEFTDPSADITAKIDDLRALSIDESWEEFEEPAAESRAEKIKALEEVLKMAKAREAQEAELAELRALKAEREAADKAREEKEAAERAEREAEEKRAKEKADAEARAEKQRIEAEARAKAEAEQAETARKEKVTSLLSYIEEVRSGMIGGQPQATGILLYELQNRIAKEIGPHLGVDEPRVELARIKALDETKEAHQKAGEQRAAELKAEEKARAEADRKAMEEAKTKAEQETADRLKREADEKARAEAIENERRAADKEHRENIRSEIIAALAGMKGRATPEAIADALMAGTIPHVKVTL